MPTPLANRILLFCWPGLLLLSGGAARPPLHAATPAEEAASFRLADPHLTIELVAAEPEVVSPVAVAWDGNGRLFVAEMRDYPNAAEGGQIRMLEDEDGDGRFERVSVFADKLPFPNGVMPWNGGVLVTAAPDLWFVKDQDGDGRADERRVLFTGFAPGNQQLRVNGLMWGLDNWVYGANGRSDGEVRPGDRPDAAPVPLRGHDFRFRPATGEFELVAGRSQFGLARDDWGNRFLSWNTIPIRHEVLAERYLSRNPSLAATDSLQNLLEPGDNGAIFPLTPPPLTFNSESTSHFNALSGLCVFRGDALGPAYAGNAFVGESLRNLVHRRVLTPQGPTFVARRAEFGREFLASTDPWFHPVNFATGPDGALYIVDFYRRFVEHPDFVRGAARQEMAWRAGAEHGRLWRIRRRSTAGAPARPRLERAEAAELVDRLGHANGWVRDTAQRLLFERQERSVGPALERVARAAAHPPARVHALHLLDGIGALSPETLRRALKDRHPRVRENAVRLSGGSPGQEIREELLRRARDGDARVRFELALALGGWDKAHDRMRLQTLAELAQRDATNHWHALAILTSAGSSPVSLLAELFRREPRWLRAPTLAQAEFVVQLAQTVGAGGGPGGWQPLLDLLAGSRAQSRRGGLAVAAGLAEGLARTPEPLRQRLAKAGVDEDSSAGELARLIELAVSAAADDGLAVADRLLAIRAARHAPSAWAAPALERSLSPAQPLEIQRAAATAAAEAGDAELFEVVFGRWRQYTRAVQRVLALAAVRSPVAGAELVRRLQEGPLQAVELEVPVRQALLRHGDATIRRQAETLLRGAASSDRDEVIQRYQPALQLAGDRRRGAGWFGRTCLICHPLHGQGQAVGPDLSGLGSRPKDAVLQDVLAPNRQVSPDFVSYTVVTTAGETLTGLLAAETSTSITLRRSGQPDATILRQQILEWRADGKSLMPEGLEQGLTVQDLADLLEFLRQPEAGLLPKSP